MGGILSNTSTEVRINLTIDKETGAKLDKHVPWGMKAAVVRALIVLAVNLFDKYGSAALGLILAGEVEIRLRKDRLKEVNNV